MTLLLAEKARLCHEAADGKKALDIVLLDLAGLSDVADIFMIASGTSSRHVQTIVNAIESALRENGEKDYHIEGYQTATWALIDTGDLVAHIFYEETRDYYALEKLWADAALFDCKSRTVA